MKTRQAAKKRASSALERWLRRDPEYRALSRAIHELQAAIRRKMTAETWQLFLQLEEHVNARHVRVVETALAVGVRAGLTRP